MPCHATRRRGFNNQIINFGESVLRKRLVPPNPNGCMYQHSESTTPDGYVSNKTPTATQLTVDVRALVAVLAGLLLGHRSGFAVPKMSGAR